ncbi:MAG: isopenicillin N synthase family oxygenase [Alphaproteobacteria bacterium]|nr:isopenicillin N synthase family oxygenase [Alphaproteobacteria bacterium]
MNYATAKTIRVEEIPVIDVAPLAGDDLAAQRAVAAQMREAAERIGFFYVRNHGVPQPVVDRMFATSKAFFALPPETKAGVTINEIHRGWLAVGQAKMYAGAKIDLKESFLWGLELGADDPDVKAGKKLMGPNQWPSFMPEMREALSTYYDGILGCGRRLLRGFALSLNRPADFFASHFAKPLARGSAIYYPPQPPDLGETQFGVAPHTDYGGLTLLAQDMTGGLQVLNKAGEWVTAHPIPGTLVINVGDLMARWTNNRFSSNAHRVVNTSGRERYSVAVFFDPAFDTVIDPRDLLDDPTTAKYPATTCGEYIVGRFDKAFKYRQRAG